MSFDIASFSLASALANAGTVTVGYPAGRSKGNYSLTNGNHKLQVGQNIYTSPKHFKLTFNANASNITLTNVAMGTLAANSQCSLQIDFQGRDSDVSRVMPPVAVGSKVIRAFPYIIDLGSPLILNTSGICASQSVTAAASFLLNGTGTDVTANADGSVTLGTPRNITAAWTTTSILTITGKDEQGNAMIEKSASSTSHTGKKAFKSITSISSSASITSATVGYGDVLGLPVALQGASQIQEIWKDGAANARGPANVRLYGFLDVTDTGVGTAASVEFLSPITGYIRTLGAIVRTAISTGGDVSVAIGTTAVVGLTVTVANSATKGTAGSTTVATSVATAAVNKGDRIQIIAGDAFTGGGDLDVYLDIEPSVTAGVTYGTFVPALASDTVSTATTADVRGTFTPPDATDGSAGYKILVILSDPSDIGIAQYIG